MRRVLFLIILLSFLLLPAQAAEFTAPQAPEEVEALIPAEKESFGEGLWQIVKAAISELEPELAEAFGICLSLIALILLISTVQSISERSTSVLELAGTLAVGGILLYRTNSLIQLGAQTVNTLSEYGRLLLPVMTAALAAQGGTTSSAAIYSGTVVFDALLSTATAKLLIPMVYMFLALALANAATGEDNLKKIADFIRWLMTWALKIILYVFTGYIGITGVVSGTTDASLLKAAKLTISGMVPVVGGILSDASEAVIVGAGVMKSAAGVYGVFALLAIWIMPFMKLGLQYLLLKATAALCAAFGAKRVSGLIQDFSSAMGLLLAMTGTVCLLLLISTVCFMKGVG